MAMFNAYPMTPLNQLRAELIDFDTAILSFALGRRLGFVSWPGAHRGMLCLFEVSIVVLTTGAG